MIGLVQRYLEAIYAIEAPDIRDFLVDAEAVRAVLGEGARPAREWVLVRQRLERCRDLAGLLAELRAFHRRPWHARLEMLRRAA